MRISSHQALLHFSSSGQVMIDRLAAGGARLRRSGFWRTRGDWVVLNAISGSTTWETSKVERHASANAAADRSAFSEAGEKSIAQKRSAEKPSGLLQRKTPTCVAP